uniref:non-specific serine/threonine protein kinase n=1 Tax=Acrobeloides nanus TaxID=290746 RepID=A0A914CF31_9BILA
MTDKNPGKSTNAQEAKKKREVAQAVSTYLESGTILLNKYQIERRIASGGFGQIYRVKFQKAENITLAAKVSRREVAHFRRMILEQMILTKLRGKKHVPMIIASGNYKEFMFIIMRMLGPDLARIRRKTEQKRFSVPTVLQFGIQAIEALKDVHDRGYLHRDVKPRNFCIGAENDRRRFYLIDYGMTRRFICEKSGVPRAPRRCAGFRGTARYVSVTVHDRKEQPKDHFHGGNNMKKLRAI